MCVPFRFAVVVVSFSWFLLREWKTRIIVMKQEKINDHISKGDPPLRKNVDVEKKISCHNIRAIDSRFDWRQKFDRKWAATEVNCFDAFSASLLELDKHKGHHFALSAVRIICTDVTIHCRCLFLFLTWQKKQKQKKQEQEQTNKQTNKQETRKTNKHRNSLFLSRRNYLNLYVITVRPQTAYVV